MVDPVSFFQYVALCSLLKIVEECCLALKRRLPFVFNLYLEPDARAAYTSEILNCIKRGDQSDAATSDDRPAEAHFVHAIINHHL